MINTMTLTCPLMISYTVLHSENLEMTRCNCETVKIKYYTINQ